MATLRQYFETDFSNAVRMHVKIPVGDSDLEAIMLYDFTAYTAYLACYIDGEKGTKEDFEKLLESIDYGKTKLVFSGNITLPSARFHHGTLKIENKDQFEILSQYFGDPSWVSSLQFQASRRIFFYSESDLPVDEILELKSAAEKAGHDLQFRSNEYMEHRTKLEEPIAFISHDSRDKDAVARKIAINLQKMLCPVWYDEFSLKVGTNLRDSIEKGLKECKKCILVLSPRFFSNKGWTKKEFDSIFTREILEETDLILPVWHEVTKEQVYDYCPSLLNVKGISWEQLGETEVCRQLNRALTN